MQHWLIQTQLGFLLHPTISPPPGGIARALDIGCGNAAWLIELSSQLPAANLVGIDLLPGSFPHKSFLPENVVLHKFDIFTDSFPPGFAASFDVINVRALATVLPDCDPKLLLEKVSSLLKPGGFLQWVDSDNLERYGCIEPEGSETGSAATQQLMDVFKPLFKGRKIKQEAWEDWEGRYGMQILRREASVIPKELYKGWTESSLQVSEDYTERFPPSSTMKQGQDGISREDYQGLLSKVYEETGRGGVAINLKEYVVLIARKLD